MLKVALIVGSTRPNRFADTPVKWLVEGVFDNLVWWARALKVGREALAVGNSLAA